MAASTAAGFATPAGQSEDYLTSPRRHWPRRLLIGLIVVVAIALIGAGSLYGYISYRFGQIHRVTIAGLTIGTSSGGGYLAPMNILIVGSDTRAALSDANQFGGDVVGGSRSDTIMIAHLDPQAGTAALLSIPRDLWVPIQGLGTQRINAAFNTGPDLLVRTIQDDLGIPINHFVDLDFDTFKDVVNALGGVKFWYPEPVKDDDNGVNDSGLNVTAAGCYNLTGTEALSLVRTRHLVYEENGVWLHEGESDLARIRRQQIFVKKVINKAESVGILNISALNGVVGGIVNNLTVDSGMSQSLMLKLAKRYRNFNPSTLPTVTLPTDGAVVGGADVLLLDKTQAPGVIAAWQGPATPAPSTSTTGPAVAPSSITVGVLNGSGRSGEARSATNALSSLGFVASVSGNGDGPNFNYTTPVVEYAPGDQSRANVLKNAIAGGAQLQSDSNLTAGNLLFITGSQYTGVSSTSTPGGASTSTTVAPAAPTAPQPPFPGIHGNDPPPPGSGC